MRGWGGRERDGEDENRPPADRFRQTDRSSGISVGDVVVVVVESLSFRPILWST